MGPSASPQLLRNLRELFRIELGFATRPPRTPQGTSTTTPPISIPSTDTLATHPQLARNGGQDQLAGSKQEIGRASCRERGEAGVEAGVGEKEEQNGESRQKRDKTASGE